MRRLAAVTLAALALYTYGLGVGTLWDQDEPRYFQITRDLVASGDPFDLRLDGAPWFVHPPLFFWLQAGAARALGYTEVAARLWSAVSGALIVAATFLLGRLLYGGRTGLAAAAIAGTTLHVLAQARLAVFDPTLVAFMLLALHEVLVWDGGGPRRAAVWAGVWAGLATATKGPIGLLLPLWTAMGLWAWRRDWRTWRRLPPAAIAAWAALGLPHYVVQTLRHGAAFLQVAVGYYMVNRFFGVVENQPGAWWYYAPVLLVGTYPWTGAVPAALALLWSERAGRGARVVLLWCGLTVVFYSLAGTKLPNYVLPVYPVLAIGLAHLWVRVLDGAVSRRLWRGTVALLPGPAAVFLAAVVVYGWLKFPAEAQALRPVLAVAAAVFTVPPLVAWALALGGRRAAALGALLAGPVLAVPVLVHHTLPAVEAYKPLPRVAAWLRQTARPDDAVVAVRLRTAAAFRFYLDRPVRWADTEEELREAVCGASAVFVVVTEGPDERWLRGRIAAAAPVHQDRWARVWRLAAPAPCARAPAPAR